MDASPLPIQMSHLSQNLLLSRVSHSTMYVHAISNEFKRTAASPYSQILYPAQSKHHSVLYPQSFSTIKTILSIYWFYTLLYAYAKVVVLLMALPNTLQDPILLPALLLPTILTPYCDLAKHLLFSLSDASLQHRYPYTNQLLLLLFT